jgi:hypothetical protein
LQQHNTNPQSENQKDLCSSSTQSTHNL